MSAASRKSSVHIWQSRCSERWVAPPLVRGNSPLVPASSPPPLPPPSFPPPFHLLPSRIRSRINSNREAALRRLSASRRARNDANRVAALRRLNSNRCVSSVSLKELPIEEINRLWFNDVKTKAASNRFKLAAQRRRQDTDHRRRALNFASQAEATVLLASKGRTGLSNCGNTCFMAAAIQCLSHAVALSEYFLGDQHLASINNGAGQLTQAYCELLRCLWYPSELERGELASFSPRSFRDTLIRRAPQFAGYRQHDAHEFLCSVMKTLVLVQTGAGSLLPVEHLVFTGRVMPVKPGVGTFI